MPRVRAGRVGPVRVLAAVAVGLATLTACGGSLTAPVDRQPDPPSAAPAPPPPMPSTPLDPSSGLRQQSCRELVSEVNGHTLDMVVAFGAEPGSGPESRAGFVQAFDRFARTLAMVRATTAAADPEMRAALGDWSAANAEIAEYVARTEPRGDDVVDLGPGNAMERTARAAVEKLCGKPF